MKISQHLAANGSKTRERRLWLERLPSLVDELLRRWNLARHVELNGEAATCSYVMAVVAANGTPAVLKIGMPPMEAAHEIAGLSFWNGDPTVRLLETDNQLGAMLLERCRPGTTLRALEDHEQDAVIGGLLHRLWRSPSTPNPFRHLSVLMEHWSNETLAQSQQWFDSGLTTEGLRLFRELSHTAPQEVLLATDLHAGNVLRAEREPWLVIDPKPFLGDPAFDATQHLFNCWPRLRSNPDRTIRQFADQLGVDHERVRLWTFARAAAEPRDDWTTNEQTELARRIAP